MALRMSPTTQSLTTPPVLQEAGSLSYGSTPLIASNVIAFNSSGIMATRSLTTTVTLHNNCVYNPAGADYSGLSAGDGDIYSDPLLMSWTRGDYGLAIHSPCIDAGYTPAVPADVTTDYGGNQRFMDDPFTPDCRWLAGSCGNSPVVDIGAYEFVSIIPGDFDNSGTVDNDDLSMFLACLTGPATPYTPANLPAAPPGCTLVPDGQDHIAADFDQDGDVDQDDFRRLSTLHQRTRRSLSDCAH